MAGKGASGGPARQWEPALSVISDLVLDQSMIMDALDNALNDRAIQRDFARDTVSWAASEVAA
ncbi:MAG TPA: hypothetical protein VF070_13090 [Streptosporangiaceae bacterium]